jgi:hypothetical protein
MLRQRLADELLHELAAELRSIPVDPRTLSAHLRALELKRDLRAWEERPPDAEAVEATLGEIEHLLRDARRWKREGRVLKLVRAAP